MTPTSTSTLLSDRLSELDATALGDLAIFAGVELKVARRAAAGEAVLAGDALKLFAARGYDPITRKLIAPRKLSGALLPSMIGLGVFLQIALRKHSIRKAAKAMNVSPAAVTRLTTGIPVSINIIVKACVYLDIHPFEQCERVREAA